MLTPKHQKDPLRNFQRRRVYEITVTGVVLCLLAVLSTANFAAEEKKTRKRPPPAVVVAAAQNRDMAPVTWVSGTVISRNEARLAAEVSGRLQQVAEVGRRVVEGKAVARIDNVMVKLRLDEARAAVEREKARLEFLREEMKRLQRLAKQNNTAKTRLEQTRSDREVARNDLEIARARLQLAQEELSRHVIRAPFSGVIAERFMHPGERAAVGDDIVHLIDPEAIEVQARVPISTLGFLQEGSTLEMKADSGTLVQGTVRTLVPVGDRRSRLLDLRVEFPKGNFRVGQPLRVALPTAQARTVMAIPRDALVLRRDGTSVFRIHEGKAEKLSVSTGIASGEFIEVIGNVNAGDQVVIRGGERLRPGQAVTIINGNEI
ncbi:MAG: efflux RND transporter periplasmic adaptor subunit [Gammaproteobacteria bacterium]|nr:efflux RND transporter periplasmic adaptor subunit [Gammaproteobacteria bacterium]MDH5799754.1 efflux RND transporter periplasmic adaptor subunit [Gammaproteobacteria bacterium]